LHKYWPYRGNFCAEWEVAQELPTRGALDGQIVVGGRSSDELRKTSTTIKPSCQVPTTRFPPYLVLGIPPEAGKKSFHAKNPPTLFALFARQKNGPPSLLQVGIDREKFNGIKKVRRRNINEGVLIWCAKKMNHTAETRIRMLHKRS